MEMQFFFLEFSSTFPYLDNYHFDVLTRLVEFLFFFYVVIYLLLFFFFKFIFPDGVVLFFKDISVMKFS